MRKLLFFLFFVNHHALFAKSVLPFKEEISLSQYWLPTSVILLILSVILLIFSKKNPLKNTQNSALKLLEKKILSHKTSVYVLEYQGLQFLLADNHTEVSFYPLEPRESHEKK